VVDWIQLPHWPVFNVADSCIVCGGILAVLLAARGVSIDGTRHAAARPAGGDAAAGAGEGAPGEAGPRDEPPGPPSARDATRPVTGRPSAPGLPGDGRP
jgi:signal peptidase II